MPTLYNVRRAVGDDALGRIYDVNPDGTLGNSYDVFPDPFRGWYVSGNWLVDGSNPFNRIALGPDETNYLQISDKGVGSFTRGIQWSTLNSGQSRTTVYGVGGTVDYLDPSGTVQSIDIPLSRLAPTGRRLVVYRTGDGGEKITHVDMGSTLAELNAVVNRYIRWATPQEAAEYAIGGYLLDVGKSKNREDQRRYNSILDVMGNMPGYEESTDSEKIRGFVRLNYTQLMPLAVAVVRTAGE